MPPRGARGGALSSATAWICRSAEIPNNTDSTTAAIDTLIDVPSKLWAQGIVFVLYRAGVSWNSTQSAMLMDATTRSGDAFYVQRDSTGVLRLRVTDSAGTAVTVSSPPQSLRPTSGSLWP